MISVGDATLPLGRHVLSKPGGFGWWYGDLLDADQSGVVIIASFGLPFLPGVASSARAGRAELPGQRPSLNLALYERGRLSTYLLEEVDPEDAEWLADEDGCRIGRSRVVSELAGGRRTLRATIDTALPGSTERITGSVTIEGPVVHTAAAPAPADARHAWTPLAVGATGTAELRRGDTPLMSVRGRAYHDRNRSDVPLDDLGIRHWLWGRVPDGERDHVYYLLWPSNGGAPVAWWLTIAADGSLTTRQAEVELSGWRLTRYLASWWRRLELTDADGHTLQVDVERLVDNGPFYQRFVVRTPGGAPGFGERVIPGRIDAALIRPFVRMSVWPAHHRSFLAPWFLGPRQDRLRRLIAAWSNRPLLGVRG